MCFMQIGYIFDGTLCNICNPLTFRQHQAESVQSGIISTFIEQTCCVNTIEPRKPKNKDAVSNLPQIFKLQ